MDADSSSPLACDHGAKTMIEDTIAAELSGAATQEQRPSTSANGFVESHPFALTTLDTTWTVPDVLPSGSLAWPAPLLELRRTMRYNSLVGVFAELSRVWFTADNKLVLWDYQSNCEFTVFDELPEIIIAVGNPVRPRPGVFQPHVTFVLPIATLSMCSLVGVCVLGEMNEARGVPGLRVVSMGYHVGCDTLMTRIVGVATTGRIFCAAADGNLYELVYHRENGLFVSRIRLACFSYRFASTPILGQLSALASSLTQTWRGPRAGLRDLVVDTMRDLLITLDDVSTIALWRVCPSEEGGGLRHVRSLPHQPRMLSRQGGGGGGGGGDASTMMNRYTTANANYYHDTNHSYSSSMNDGGGLMNNMMSHIRGRKGGSLNNKTSPTALQRIFVTDADHDGCTLVAVARNGDQYRYSYLGGLTSGLCYNSLVLRSYTPSRLTPRREVNVCLATSSMVLLAHAETEREDSSAETNERRMNDTAGDVPIPTVAAANSTASSYYFRGTNDSSRAAGCSSRENDAVSGPDAVVAITSPSVIMEPHSHYRDVVTTMHAPSARIVRVDAMEQLPDEAVCQRSPNELCWQVYAPPTRYMLVHRHGLFVCLQTRPVDLLYLILSSATSRARETLLRRFAAVYNTTDYACMLLQIAAGAMNTVDLTGSTSRFQRCAANTSSAAVNMSPPPAGATATVGNNDNHSHGMPASPSSSPLFSGHRMPSNRQARDSNYNLPSSSSTMGNANSAGSMSSHVTGAAAASAEQTPEHRRSGNFFTAESLGARVECADSLDACRLARELLRDLAHPLCEGETVLSHGVRQLSIVLSPLANAVVLFAARALYGVWDVAATRLSLAQLAVHEAPLSALLRYLDSLDMNLRDGMSEEERVQGTAAAAATATPFSFYNSTNNANSRNINNHPAMNVEEMNRAGFGCWGVQWQRGRMLLTLPMTSASSVSTGRSDAASVDEVAQEQRTVHYWHREMLRSAYHVVWKAAQTMLLLRHTQWVPFPAEMRHVTVSQLVRDGDSALRLGRYLSFILLGVPVSSPHGADAVPWNKMNNYDTVYGSSSSSSNLFHGYTATGTGRGSSEQWQAFHQLQRRCPYFFCAADVMELLARSEMEQLIGGDGLGAMTDSRMTRWVASVAPRAAAYWNSGTLDGVCRQLCALQREEVAVQLLLHAARQLDVRNACVPLYLRQGFAVAANLAQSDDAAAATAADNGNTMNGRRSASYNNSYNTNSSYTSNNDSGNYVDPARFSGAAGATAVGDTGCCNRSNNNIYGSWPVNEMDRSVYEKKRCVLQRVIAVLEQCWVTNRAAVDRLLGSANLSTLSSSASSVAASSSSCVSSGGGRLWQVEPQDEMAHYWLMDWLSAPRDDAAIAHYLRAALLTARSVFLEPYLQRRARELSEEYVLYLRCVKKDAAAALVHAMRCAQSLTHCPFPAGEERLRYRVRCLTEALACARECGDDASVRLVEEPMRRMEVQQRLYEMIARYVKSDRSTLDQVIQLPRSADETEEAEEQGQRYEDALHGQHRQRDGGGAGSGMTERELALRHLARLGELACDMTELLQIAGMYPTLGGDELQLDLLVATGVANSTVLIGCVSRMYTRCRCSGGDVAALTRRVVKRYYRATAAFPMNYILRELEADGYVSEPGGSCRTVTLLLDCQVDGRVLLHCYCDVLEGSERRMRDATDEVECLPFVQAKVTTGYLIHSLAVVVQRLSCAARAGVVTLTMVSDAMRLVRDYLAQAMANFAGDRDEQHALEKANRILSTLERGTMGEGAMFDMM